MFFLMTVEPHSGSAFMSRLKERHEGTLTEITRDYLPQIYRAARGAGLSVQNAEDAAQNTFVTFMEKLDDFEGRSHVRTWLFGILYRKISEMRRGAQREEKAEDIEEVMETRFKTNGFWAKPPRDTDSTTFDRDIRTHLNDCLDDITSDQRLAFIMREVDEMDSDEICQAMEVSRSNLGVLLYRGRNKLRECLEHKNFKG